jgi:hypothetical protein
MRRKNVGIAHCSECLTDPPEFVAEQPAPRALIARRIERSRRTATRIWWMSSESSTSRAPGSWLRSSESSSAASRARSRSRPDGPRSDNGTTRSSFVPVARACAEFSQPSLDSSEALFAAVDEFGLDLGERSLARSSVDDVDGVERHVDTLNTPLRSVTTVANCPRGSSPKRLRTKDRTTPGPPCPSRRPATPCGLLRAAASAARQPDVHCDDEA